MKARILLLAVALVAGCAAAPSPPAEPPAIAPPRPSCARQADEVREVVLDPAINLRVTVLLTGAGPRGIAIFPEAASDICQLADLAHRLADTGYRLATFGPWSSPYERPVTATYAALIAAGAQRAVVLGASQGATLALATAPTLNPRQASSRCPRSRRQAPSTRLPRPRAVRRHEKYTRATNRSCCFPEPITGSSCCPARSHRSRRSSDAFFRGERRSQNGRPRS